MVFGVFSGCWAIKRLSSGMFERLSGVFVRLKARREAMRNVQIGFGVAVGLLFCVLLVRSIDLPKVGSLLAQSAIGPLLLGLVAFAADFALRGVRFWAMLQVATGKKHSLRASMGPFIASFGISDILPLRAGDGFRVLWFSRRFDISMGAVIGAMAVERALDLLTVLVFAAAALALTGIAAPSATTSDFQSALIWIAVGAAVAVFASALIVRWLARHPSSLRTSGAGRLLRGLADGLRTTSTAVLQMISWRWLGLFVMLSLSCWILEYLVFFAAWVSLGGAIDAVAAPFLAFAFSTLGTLLPGLPGHFGTFEYFGLKAFVLAGVDPSFAAAVLFLAHLLLWLPTALFGAGWVLAQSLQSYRG